MFCLGIMCLGNGYTMEDIDFVHGMMSLDSDDEDDSSHESESLGPSYPPPGWDESNFGLYSSTEEEER